MVSMTAPHHRTISPCLSRTRSAPDQRTVNAPSGLSHASQVVTATLAAHRSVHSCLESQLVPGPSPLQPGFSSVSPHANKCSSTNVQPVSPHFCPAASFLYSSISFPCKTVMATLYVHHSPSYATVHHQRETLGYKRKKEEGS